MKKILSLSAFLFLMTGVFFAPSMALAEETQKSEAAEQESPLRMVSKWINFAALVAILYLFLKKTIKVQEKFQSDSEEIQRSIESVVEPVELRVRPSGSVTPRPAVGRRADLGRRPAVVIAGI